MRSHVGVVLVAAGYFALALVADATALETRDVIAFWPANGLLLGLLLLTDKRRWPALIAAGAVGAAAFNLSQSETTTSLVFVVADIAVVVVGAFAVRAWCG